MGSGALNGSAFFVSFSLLPPRLYLCRKKVKDYADRIE